MSVIAPDFNQLVSESEYVIRGVVTNIRCVTADTSQGQAIRTLVTFHVEKALKGSPGSDVTLVFLGGKVGHRTLTVVGMPRFAVGQHEIVFVANNGRAICPLIAGGYGRYHIRHDAATNTDRVFREDGAPLESTDDVGKPLGELHAATAAAAGTHASAGGMTPATFEARIDAAVHGNGKTTQP